MKSFRSLFIYFSGSTGLASGPSVLHVLTAAGAKVRAFGIPIILIFVGRRWPLYII